MQPRFPNLSVAPVHRTIVCAVFSYRSGTLFRARLVHARVVPDTYIYVAVAELQPWARPSLRRPPLQFLHLVIFPGPGDQWTDSHKWLPIVFGAGRVKQKS